MICVSRPAPSGHCAVTGSQPSQIAEDEDQDDARDVVRHRGERDPRDGDRLVGRACRSEARRSRRRGSRAGRRCTNARSASFAEFRIAGPSRSQAGTWRCSDIPRSPWTSPPAQSRYCVEERPVRAELLVERVDRLLRRERPEHRATDVARQDVGHGEHDHAEQEQRDQREPEALEDEADHRRPFRRDGRWRRLHRPRVLPFRRGSTFASRPMCEIPSGT